MTTPLPTDWKTRVLATAPAFLARNELFTMEDIRRFCDIHGCGEPAHHNSWGCVIGGLRMLHMVEKAEGQMRSSKSKQSHGRKLQVWRSKLFTGAGERHEVSGAVQGLSPSADLQKTS